MEATCCKVAFAYQVIKIKVPCAAYNANSNPRSVCEELL